MMFNYLIKKGLILLGSLLTVITITFFLMHSIPGDPFTNDQVIPEEVLKTLHHHYGLDQPLFTQYLNYLDSILHFDFGPSLKYPGRTVNQIIGQTFPISLSLGIEALFISIVAGIAFGAIAALQHLQWGDRLAMLLVILGISVPSFLLGTFLQYFLAIKLDLLPVARWGSFSHTIMPALSLAAFPMAFIARLTRANMIEVLQQDYIVTAKSKGLNSFQIIRRHVIRNALIPVIAYIGPLIAAIFIGSFTIEKIFGIPGLGQWFVASISNRDYTVIMGVTILYTTILLVSVFLVDLVSFWLLPGPKGQYESL